MSLYKYLVPERIDVLKNVKIRFSQYTVLNDPFEMKPYFEGVASDSFLTQFFNESWQPFGQNLLKDLDSIIPEEWKDEHYKSTMSQLPKDENPAMDLLLNTHKAMMPELRNVMLESFENVGVLCLTEEQDNLLMWAHYAKNYKGFVLEFDDKHEFFQQKDSPMREFTCAQKVEYSENRPNRATFTELNQAEIFFLKSEEWAYEKEWRMIRPLPTEKKDEVFRDLDQQPVYLFDFPPECVTGIIFGSRMPDETKIKFLEFLSTDERYFGVKAYQAVLDEKKFISERAFRRDAVRRRRTGVRRWARFPSNKSFSCSQPHGTQFGFF